MSRETLEWLNTHTLIGFSDKRGNAWHYKQSAQGDEPNHYAGAIPVADVRRRLFNFEAVERPVTVSVQCGINEMTHLDADGMPSKYVELGDSKAIVHSVTGDVFKVAGQTYAIHQYGQWLLDSVCTIIGDGLSIGSAGLLDKGAVAWVSVEVPDSITTPEGVEFRPNLLATTSHNSRFATTYKRVVTNVVCDNTHAAAMGESGQEFRVKHTRNSGLRITEAQDALLIINDIGDTFAAEVKALCEQEVSRTEFSKFLDLYAPLTDDKGERKSGRGLTTATNEQDALTRLYLKDFRVAPWTGTAWGVVQAVNTYVHHERTVRGADRQERNMLRAVAGSTLDSDTLSVLNKARELVRV